VTSYEAGLRFQEERVQASLATFLTQLSDDLVFDPATARNELVPSTRRLGVAAQVVSRPLPQLLASASVTYARAAFERSGGQYARGDLLPYVPQLVARLDVGFTPVLGRLLEQELRGHFGAAVTGLARRPLPYAEMGHDVFLADVRAAFQLGALETGLDVQNLFDADWYDGEFVYSSQFGDAASLVPVRHVTVGPPLTFLWSLTLHV
jgi:outer membrane receptor protein involved in Fe transport